MGQRSGTRARQEEVLRLVRGGTGRVEDIADSLAVSASTVRRDLARLAEDGLLARTYGGAQSGPRFTELALGERLALAFEGKAAIGAVAAGLISPGATVFIDAGSTCAQLAEHLRERHDLTVVTRGLEIAAALVGDGGPRVVLLGGTVAAKSHGMVGPLTEHGLVRHRFDVAFLGCDAIHPRDGIGEPTVHEAATKETAAGRADRVVALADATKLTRTGVPVWAPLPAGWTLITDADETHTAPFSAAGIEVLRAVEAHRAPRSAPSAHKHTSATEAHRRR
ncbi:MAG: DeoR/GlpR family DNA-binding transcription regulator [Mobilicoccus sp.]|nr:DeoR/GlpR family DNA-binding transcription regulator [Mobilicoccus sp.]